MKTAPFLALSLAISPLARADVTAVVQGPNGTVRTSIFSEQNAMLPIAQVEDRVVTLQDLSDALAATHQAHGAMAETKKSLEGGKKDYTPVLDRLIGTRLIALEAREMGIADLPEINEEMAGFREASLREALRTDAGFAQAHYFLGRVLEQSGKDAEAIDELRTAARLAPGMAEPEYSLGLLYRRLGRTDEASQALDEYKKRREAAPAAPFSPDRQ